MWPKKCQDMYWFSFHYFEWISDACIHIAPLQILRCITNRSLEYRQNTDSLRKCKARNTMGVKMNTLKITKIKSKSSSYIPPTLCMCGYWSSLRFGVFLLLQNPHTLHHIPSHGSVQKLPIAFCPALEWVGKNMR